jgi:hypothetical protein
LGLLEDHTCSSGRGYGQTTNDRNAHHAFFVDFVVDQLPQTLSLQISRFQIQEIVIVPPGFSIVAKFVVSKG